MSLIRILIVSAVMAGCVGASPAAPAGGSEPWTASTELESYLGAAFSDPAGYTVLEGCNWFALGMPSGASRATLTLELLPSNETASFGTLVLQAASGEGAAYSSEPVSTPGDRASIDIDRPAPGDWGLTVRPESASVEQSFRVAVEAVGDGPRGDVVLEPNPTFC